MSNKILSMQKISKSFPGVKALDEVDLNAYQGKVMALLGENGAGKSTLMKILTAVYSKDEGSIYYKGQELNLKNPKQATESGIAIIHQELNLISELTIAENIFLGREPKTSIGTIDWGKMFSEGDKLLKMLAVDIKSNSKVKDLSIGIKQMVEIAKALSLDAELIIMDEPTDALTDKETLSLFKIIRQLREQHKSIIYISHRLEEIFEICDDVTVLRDGKFVAEKKVSEIDQDDLIEMMVGRRLEEQYPYLAEESAETVLEVKQLSNAFVQNISFDLKAKEIVGVAGLMGAGRTELAKTLYGHYRTKSGSINLFGKEIKINSEREAIANGIVYVSEDRKKDGLVLAMSVEHNITLSALQKIANSSFISKKSEATIAQEFIDKMTIKTPSKQQIVKNLSGGNQQKVSIAKCLFTEPKVLILDEPTRGVDVGAKKEIYNLINEFKTKGMSILMISSEIPEILGMCDRVLVMHEGSLAGELSREQMTQEKIMRLAVGITDSKGENND